MLSIFWYVLIFFLGASVGSFLNVLVTRTVRGEGWVKGRSRCDHCKKTLASYDMIPVLSYLLYRGKSRCCHKPLSYQHLVVESLTGLLFVWWAALSSAFFLLVTQPGQTAQPVFWLITGILFLAIAVSDQYYGVIPLPFVWIGVILTLGYRLILIMTGTYMPMDLVWSVVAAGVLSGFYLLLRGITRGAGMGEGDVWLAIYLGLVMGWTRILTGTMVAFVGGSIVGIVLIMFKLKTRKETIPFGPFMVLGAIASLIWG